MADLDDVTTPSKTAHRAEQIVLALGVIILFASPHDVRGDGQWRFDALARLLDHGEFFCLRGSMIGALLSSPLYLLGRAFGNPAGFCAFYNVLLFSGALVLFARELRHYLPPHVILTFSVLMVYASMFPSHVQLYYSEVFTALTVCLGILYLARDRAAVGWTLLFLGGANVPASAVGIGFVALRYAWRTRTLRYLAIPILVVASSLLENRIFRGSFASTGYEGDHGHKTVLPYSGLSGFSYPFFLGLLSIVASFGKGIFFFAPGLMLAPPRRDEPSLRWAYLTMLAFLAGIVIVYAKWWSWFGGWFWGPRFFLSASIPSALALAIHLHRLERRRALLALLVAAATLLAFWVGVNGLVFDTSGLDVCTRNDAALEAMCLYVPELSVLWHPFVDFASTVPPRTRSLAIAIVVVWMSAGIFTARRALVVATRGAVTYAKDWTRAVREATWKF